MSLLSHSITRGFRWAAEGPASGGVSRFARSVQEIRRTGLSAVQSVRLSAATLREIHSAARPQDRLEALVDGLKTGSIHRLGLELDSSIPGHREALPDSLKAFQAYLTITQTAAERVWVDLGKHPVPALKSSAHKPGKMTLTLKSNDPKNFLFSIDLPAAAALGILNPEGAAPAPQGISSEKAPEIVPASWETKVEIIRTTASLEEAREAVGQISQMLEDRSLGRKKVLQKLGNDFWKNSTADPGLMTRLASLLHKSVDPLWLSYLYLSRQRPEEADRALAAWTFRVADEAFEVPLLRAILHLLVERNIPPRDYESRYPHLFSIRTIIGGLPNLTTAEQAQLGELWDGVLNPAEQGVCAILADRPDWAVTHWHRLDVSPGTPLTGLFQALSRLAEIEDGTFQSGDSGQYIQRYEDLVKALAAYPEHLTTVLGTLFLAWEKEMIRRVIDLDSLPIIRQNILIKAGKTCSLFDAWAGRTPSDPLDATSHAAITASVAEGILRLAAQREGNPLHCSARADYTRLRLMKYLSAAALFDASSRYLVNKIKTGTFWSEHVPPRVRKYILDYRVDGMPYLEVLAKGIINENSVRFSVQTTGAVSAGSTPISRFSFEGTELPPFTLFTADRAKILQALEEHLQIMEERITENFLTDPLPMGTELN